MVIAFWVQLSNQKFSSLISMSIMFLRNAAAKNHKPYLWKRLAIKVIEELLSEENVTCFSKNFV